MTAQVVCDPLRMAIWQRRPKAGLIVHSDRGSQYASHAYRRLLKAHDDAIDKREPCTASIDPRSVVHARFYTARPGCCWGF
jgi:transposase InsO family protein